MLLLPRTSDASEAARRVKVDLAALINLCCRFPRVEVNRSKQRVLVPRIKGRRGGRNTDPDNETRVGSNNSWTWPRLQARP